MHTKPTPTSCCLTSSQAPCGPNPASFKPSHSIDKASKVGKDKIGSTPTASNHKFKVGVGAITCGALAVVITILAIVSLNVSVIIGGLVIAAPLAMYCFSAIEKAKSKNIAFKKFEEITSDIRSAEAFKSKFAEWKWQVDTFLIGRYEADEIMEDKDVIYVYADKLSTDINNISSEWQTVYDSLSSRISRDFLKSRNDSIKWFNTTLTYVNHLKADYEKSTNDEERVAILEEICRQIEDAKNRLFKFPSDLDTAITELQKLNDKLFKK